MPDLTAKDEQDLDFLLGEANALFRTDILLHIHKNGYGQDPTLVAKRAPFLQLCIVLITTERDKRLKDIWEILAKKYGTVVEKVVEAHADTGGPDQGGEFVRGVPGHPDNEMGM